MMKAKGFLAAVGALSGVVAAMPVVAHEAGAHLHPHGSEGWLALLPAAVLIATAALVAGWRR